VTELASPGTAALQADRRRLVLVWQDPVTRRFVRVGHLDEFASGRYTFSYDAGASTASFDPLAEFPSIDGTYVSDRLPAFFGNRVMDRGRGGYAEYRGWLGLEVETDTPFEVLVRTGGGRATDTFHVVDDLRVEGDAVTTRFFVSGIRHVQRAADEVAALRAGATLTLRRDPHNQHNPLAVLLDAAPDRPIGFVPDWLVEEVCELIDSGRLVDVVAERVNSLARPHLRVLCRLSAQRGR